MSDKLYRYQAAMTDGTLIRGQAHAASPQDLYHQLKAQDYYLVSSHIKRMPQRSHKPSAQELADFCLHMQYMEQANVTLLDALHDAHKNAAKLKPVLTQMIASIKAGKMLSEAVAEHPDFPNIFAPILALAEQSGNLADAFKTLHEHLIWNENCRRQIWAGLRYPAVVFALLCVVITMMTNYVIPQMQELLVMSNVTVPYTSQLLLSINQTLVLWSPRILLLLGLAATGLMCLRLAPRQRLWQDRVWLKIPIIGPLLRKRDAAMFLHFFHVCMASNMDLLQGLQAAQRPVRNLWLQQQLDKCAKSVHEGCVFSEALADTGMFDPSAIRMIQVGEVTGQLVPLLALIESFQLKDLKRQIDQFISFLQPALLVIIGLILAWIVIGIFYPIYDQLLIIEE